MTDDTDPNELTPAPETDPNTPETAQTAPPEAPEGATAAPPPEEDEQAKRIARLAHDARDARRRARQLQAEVEVLRGQRAPDDADTQRHIDERAQQIAADQAFNTKCNAIYAEGVKTYGKSEFDESVKAINGVFGQMPPQFVEACVDAGDPHQLLQHLGDNPDVLEDIAQLPPHRMGAALAKLSAKLNAPVKRQVSKAPPPINPVGGNAKADFDPDKCSIEEYMAFEDKRMMERRYH